MSSRICPVNRSAECQTLIDKLGQQGPIPTDFLEEILAGQQGLLGRCGGYLNGFSKDSPAVSGCVMGHLKNPNITFPPTLFLWGKGLPTGAKPRSLNEALKMKREMIPLPPLTRSGATLQPPPLPPPQNNIFIEKSLADLGFQFRYVDEWKEVETTIETIRDGAIHTLVCNWSYKLTQNDSNSYTVEWRRGNENGNLVFPVVENQYPKNLVLVLLGDFSGDTAQIKGIQLKLK